MINSSIHILIVDDAPVFRASLRGILEQTPGEWICHEADNVRDTVAAMKIMYSKWPSWSLSTNLRRRINDHLDNEQKTSPTVNGRAVLFCWIESKDINKIERTWLNIHIQHEGAIPVLNKIYSPVSI